MDSRFNTKFNATTLLLANLFAICSFIFGGGSITQVLITFWLQSVIIGVVNVFRILRTKPRTVKYLGSSNDNNLYYALFFVIHYGAFHIAYLVYLLGLGFGSEANSAFNLKEQSAGISIVALTINSVLFAIHHISTYRQESLSESNILAIFFKPYARVVPMHVVLIAAGHILNLHGVDMILFVIFTLLKMITDLVLFNLHVSHPSSTNHPPIHILSYRNK